MELKTDTWVVVADGTKYLVLQNVGWPDQLDLRVLSHDDIQNPPTRAQISDRAGARPMRASWGQSAMDQPDVHDAQEAAFAKRLVEKLNQWAEKNRFKHIVIFADPKTLGEMRPGYSRRLKDYLVGEVSKDLTNLAIPDIETVVSAA